MSQHLSEQEIIRREKLAKIQAAGIDAYPAPLYRIILQTLKTILQKKTKKTLQVFV